MHVITGFARGRRLLALAGEEVRPTAARVKEAMFSIIQFDLEGRRVLDLFAGSGQLGIEALSRGASSAVFVDVNSASIRVIRENLAATGFAERAQVLCMDYMAYLTKQTDPFDIAFLDPPYRRDLAESALRLLAPRMNAGGVILCEHAGDSPLPDDLGNGWRKARDYRYGHVTISLYRDRENR